VSAASAIIDRAIAFGCTLTLDGDHVRLRASRPLPEDVLAELRHHKTEVVHFLASRQRGGVPLEWLAGVETLIAADPVADWRQAQWQALQAALPAFVTTWAPRVAMLGWSTLDVFGCHPVASFNRLDMRGLALSLHDARIVAVAEHSAGLVFKCSTSPMTFSRCSPSAAAEAVPLWRAIGREQMPSN